MQSCSVKQAKRLVGACVSLSMGEDGWRLEENKGDKGREGCTRSACSGSRGKAFLFFSVLRP